MATIPKRNKDVDMGITHEECLSCGKIYRKEQLDEFLYCIECLESLDERASDDEFDIGDLYDD